MFTLIASNLPLARAHHHPTSQWAWCLGSMKKRKGRNESRTGPFYSDSGLGDPAGDWLPPSCPHHSAPANGNTTRATDVILHFLVAPLKRPGTGKNQFGIYLI